ncbi:MAG: flippase-like domain-containing protein [Candidatus Peribacteraceae bacterium]|nr:flippase-like domain-containing protein [Candidatus Peribacteraceae bacterium]
MKKISLRRIITSFISLVVLVFCINYILKNFQWIEILQMLKNVNLIWLFVGGGLSILVHFAFRTLRWSFILKNLKIDIKFFDLYIYNSISIFLSIVTPARSGGILKVELLKRYDLIKRIPGYSSFILESIFDLFLVFSVAMTSLIIKLDLAASYKYIHLMFGIAVVVFFVCAFAIQKRKFKGKTGEFICQLKASFQNTKTLLLIVLLTICSWVFVAVGWQVCLYSIDIHIGFLNSVALASIINITCLLSFIPGGIGVSEAGIAELLIRFGYESIEAQTGAIVLRFYSILIIFLGGLHYLILILRRYLEKN